MSAGVAWTPDARSRETTRDGHGGVSYYPPLAWIPDKETAQSTATGTDHLETQVPGQETSRAASAPCSSREGHSAATHESTGPSVSAYGGGSRTLTLRRTSQQPSAASAQQSALVRQRARELQAKLVAQVSAQGVLQVAAESACEFTSGHVVTALHRAARLGGRRAVNGHSLAESSVWKALVERAGFAARHNELSPMSMALSVWALATAKHRDDVALEAIGGALLDRRAECKPHDLSGAAWAFATLEAASGDCFGGARFLVEIAEEAAARTAEFKPQDLSLIVWAYARVSRHDARLFESVAAAATTRHAEFVGQNLANTLWAFGTVVHASEPLFTALVNMSISNLNGLGALEVSTVLWSCASVSHLDAQLFSVAVPRIQQLASIFESQQLSSIAWAFARVAARDSRLFTLISREVVSRSLQLEPSEINRLAWAFAYPGKPAEERTGRAGGFRDPALLDHLAGQALQRMSELDALQVSSIAWAFATLAYRKDSLFGPLSIRFSSNEYLAAFDAQHVAYLVWALARLDILKQEVSHRACVEALKRGLGSFDHRHLSMLLWALARSGQRYPEFWAAVHRYISPVYADALGDAQGVASLAMVIHALNKVEERETALEVLEHVLRLGVDVSGDAYGGWLYGCRVAGDSLSELKIWEHMARTAPNRGMRAAASNMAVIRTLELLDDKHRAQAMLDGIDKEGLTNTVSQLLRVRCGSLSPSNPHQQQLGWWQPRLRSEGVRQARAAGRVLCKWDYYKEVGVLEYVLNRAAPGDAASVCAAIEAFSREEHLYLKLGAEEKGLALDAMLSELETRLPGRSADAPPPLVVEIGCYVGYSAVRMGCRLAKWPGGKLVTMEVDPYHAAVSRSVIELAGLGDVVEVWIGHSENLIPQLLPRFGHGCVHATFFDQKGTRYHEDLDLLEGRFPAAMGTSTCWSWRNALLADGALVCADNVVRPGAPEFMWRVCGADCHYETQVVAHRDYGQDSVEDWISISRFNPAANAENQDRSYGCPAVLRQLAYESDQIRNRSVNERVTEEEWRLFAVRVATEFHAAGIRPPVLKPFSSIASGGGAIGDWLRVELLPWRGPDLSKTMPSRAC